MRNRLFRLWAACIAIVAMLGVVAPAAAFAGTLTAATFTTSGTGYAITGAQNTKYDWNYTTATSATLSRVSASVPGGTNTYGSRYLALNGISGNYASTPDSAQNSITGTLDIRVTAALSQWVYSGSFYQILFAKWNGSGNFSYVLSVNNSGQAQFCISGNGTSVNCAYSSANVPFANGAQGSLRVTADSSTNTIIFYTQPAGGTTWTQLGTSVSVTVAEYDSSAPVQIGVAGPDGSMVSPGSKIYFASIANTINGTATSPTSCNSAGVQNCFNPANDGIGGSSWTSSDSIAEPWSLSRTGTNLPTDIASDLSVSSVSGLPSGGTASYRMVDGLAVYALPTATSVPASTPCSFR